MTVRVAVLELVAEERMTVKVVVFLLALAMELRECAVEEDKMANAAAVVVAMPV